MSQRSVIFGTPVRTAIGLCSRAPADLLFNVLWRRGPAAAASRFPEPPVATFRRKNQQDRGFGLSRWAARQLQEQTILFRRVRGGGR